MVWVEHTHDSVELSVTMSVLLHIVDQVDEAGLEFLRAQYPTMVLVKVLEGYQELLHLFLPDTLDISGEDLVFYLFDGAGNGGEQLLSAHMDMLHCVVCVLVLKDEGLLDEMLPLLQQVQSGLVVQMLHSFCFM